MSSEDEASFAGDASESADGSGSRVREEGIF